MTPARRDEGSLTFDQQIDLVIRFLEGKGTLNREEEPGKRFYENACRWYVNFPPSVNEEKRRNLLRLICNTFRVDEASIYTTGSGLALPANVILPRSSDAELRAILPKGKWFEWYDKYTAYTESPLSYHVFSSLAALGACLGRRVYLDMGFFNIYPNYCVILVGPTGRVKKTSAANIAMKIVEQTAACPIMADKMTPEAFNTALAEAGGHQFIYAPEFAVLLGRQKYNEGLVTQIIRMLDCPDVYKIRTVARGSEEVNGVALSFLGCTTLSLMMTSAPQEVTSSGFLNRFVVVVEQDTDRIFPIPRKGEADLGDLIMRTAKRLSNFAGRMSLSPEAYNAYDKWYKARVSQVRTLTDEVLIEVLERLPTHVLRTAMLVHLVQCDHQIICEQCFRDAIALMAYVEKRVPQTVTAMSQNQRSSEQDYVLSILRRLGGAAEHSKLLRRVNSRLDAASLKRVMGTLVESGMVKEDKRGAARYYVLQEPEDVISSRGLE